MRNVLGNIYLSSLTKNLWYEQRKHLEVEVCCHKVQGMAEAFTNTLYSHAKTSSSVHQKALFSSETADKFARDYAIEKSFRHALHLVTAHLHLRNQVAHALRTRDFWLASLSIHSPIHFARRAHEYPVTLRGGGMRGLRDKMMEG